MKTAFAGSIMLLAVAADCAQAAASSSRLLSLTAELHWLQLQRVAQRQLAKGDITPVQRTCIRNIPRDAFKAIAVAGINDSDTVAALELEAYLRTSTGMKQVAALVAPWEKEAGVKMQSVVVRKDEPADDAGKRPDDEVLAAYRAAFEENSLRLALNELKSEVLEDCLGYRIPTQTVAMVKGSEQYRAYRQGFAELSTEEDYALFIDMFAGDDPDHLVPLARKRLQELQAGAGQP